MIFLFLTSTHLTEIPANLPVDLQTLYISNNVITEIKNLPNSLQELSICNNEIRELRNLPESLQELYIDNNLVTVIQNLRVLRIPGNPIEKI